MATDQGKETLRGKKVAVLMTDGVEQAEYTEPRRFLETHGAEVTLVAPPTLLPVGVETWPCSVSYDLEVPDFARSALVMSGIVLTSSRAGMVPTPRPDEEIRKALPGPPTTARAFLAGDELALVAEIYDNKPGQPHKVAIATTVRAEDGRTVFQHADERQSSELGGRGGGYGYTARVPLRGLAPGVYVLRVEARSTLGKEDVVWREVQIGIVDR